MPRLLFSNTLLEVCYLEELSLYELKQIESWKGFKVLFKSIKTNSNCYDQYSTDILGMKLIKLRIFFEIKLDFKI